MVWVRAEIEYDRIVQKVENRIILRLKETLSTCQNASDMFRCFSTVNALFIRPKVRAAIHEYQIQLIDLVKDDIKRLHQKFVSKNSNAEALLMGIVRDVPPITSHIMWSRQIGRQLDLYIKRVEAVLGSGWKNYADGQKLYIEEMSFRNQLDMKPYFNNWIQGLSTSKLQVNGPIFSISKNRNRSSAFMLMINFDATSMVMFKEVRNLTSMKFSIPHQIGTLAKDYKRVYPLAIDLMDSLRMYQQTLNVIQQKPIANLVANFHNEVHSVIKEGIHLTWKNVLNVYDINENSEVVIFAKRFASSITTLKEKVVASALKVAEIDNLVSRLDTCDYKHNQFDQTLKDLQNIVNSLIFESLSNLDQYVLDLNLIIESKLLLRLKTANKVIEF